MGERVVLRRSGRNLMGLCPFHKEKKPVISSFGPQDGTFHCLGCGFRRSIFRFCVLMNKVEFPEALQALAARTGVEARSRGGPPQGPRISRL